MNSKGHPDTCEHCQRPCLPDDKFCILHSENEDKDLDALQEVIDEILAAEEHGFSNAVFPKGVNFEAAKFRGDASFVHAKFGGDAIFDFAKFGGDALFGDAEFGGDASFIHAKFRGEASFNLAKFGGNAIFGRARFDGEASFVGARFDGDPSFLSTEFTSPYFRNATFASWVFMHGDVKQKIFAEVTSVDLRDLNLDKPELLSFRHADLSRCRLLHTDIRNAEFTAVIWPHDKRGTFVYDEEPELVKKRTVPTESEQPEGGEKPETTDVLKHPYKLDSAEWEFSTSDYGSLEVLYRHLKKNYEDNRDYKTGGDFHYREKEIKRLNPWTHWSSRHILLPLYKYLGGYGERIRPPALAVVGVTLLALVFYSFNSLNYSPPTEPSSIGFFGNWACYFESDFLRILSYSIQVTFLKTPKGLVASNAVGALVHALHSILGPIFVGLLALSIRQRVKR
jgi:uncharacterized protein YjbI with pentapeptide repeats